MKSRARLACWCLSTTSRLNMLEWSFWFECLIVFNCYDCPPSPGPSAMPFRCLCQMPQRIRALGNLPAATLRPEKYKELWGERGDGTTKPAAVTSLQLYKCLRNGPGSAGWRKCRGWPTCNRDFFLRISKTDLLLPVSSSLYIYHVPWWRWDAQETLRTARALLRSAGFDSSGAMIMTRHTFVFIRISLFIYPLSLYMCIFLYADKLQISYCVQMLIESSMSRKCNNYNICPLGALVMKFS